MPWTPQPAPQPGDIRTNPETGGQELYNGVSWIPWPSGADATVYGNAPWWVPTPPPPPEWARSPTAPGADTAQEAWMGSRGPGIDLLTNPGSALSPASSPEDRQNWFQRLLERLTGIPGGWGSMDNIQRARLVTGLLGVLGSAFGGGGGGADLNLGGLGGGPNPFLGNAQLPAWQPGASSLGASYIDWQPDNPIDQPTRYVNYPPEGGEGVRSTVWGDLGERATEGTDPAQFNQWLQEFLRMLLEGPGQGAGAGGAQPWFSGAPAAMRLNPHEQPYWSNPAAYLGNTTPQAY